MQFQDERESALNWGDLLMTLQCFEPGTNPYPLAAASGTLMRPQHCADDTTVMKQLMQCHRPQFTTGTVQWLLRVADVGWAVTGHVTTPVSNKRKYFTFKNWIFFPLLK